MAQSLNRSHDPVKTIRFDRRTKLAVVAATLVAKLGKNLGDMGKADICAAVDGAFLVEAEIEARIKPR